MTRYIKTKRLPVEYHRYLIDAQEQRTDADYSLTPNITSKKAQDIIEKAQRMLDFAQENLEAV